MILTLLACGGAAPEPAPDPLADLSDAERQCVEAACPDATGEALEACRGSECPERIDQFEVAPQTIRYEDGTFFAEVKLDYTAGGFGDVDVPRTEEVFLGVTVITAEGEEIDLAVQTLFPKRLDDSFIFSAEVGEGVQDLIIGAWDEKIQPCEVDRYGCREFGFVLDHPLAAWPPDFYAHGHRQRLPPASLTLAGAPSVVDQAKSSLSGALSPFETEVTVETRDVERDPGVYYSHAHDWYLAHTISQALGLPGPNQGVDLGADLVVVPAE